MNKPLILLICSFLSIFNSKSQNIDSLWTVYCSDSHSGYVSSANKISEILYELEYTDSLTVFDTKTDRNIIDATVLAPLSTYMIDLGLYSETLAASTKGLAAAQAINDNKVAAHCYSSLCVIYQRLGNFSLALDYAKKCYDIDLINNDTQNLSHSLHNLAALSQYNKHYKDAKYYIDKAIEIERGQKDNGKVLAVRLGLAAEVYMEIQEYDKAINFAKEAYDLDNNEKRPAKAAIRLCQLGAVYQAKGDYDMALKYFRQAVEPLTEAKNFTSLAICYYSIGTIENIKGNNIEARNALLKSVEAATISGNNVQRQKAYSVLATILKNVSQGEAIVYYEKASALRDSLFSVESERQISNFNIQYQTREKEMQIDMKNAQIKQKTIIQHLLIIAVALCVIVILLVVHTLISQRRINRELRKMNELKDKFVSVISHDLKNPIIAQRNTLSLLANNDFSAEDYKEQCNLMLESTQSLLSLVLNLLNWSKLQIKKMSANNVNMPLADTVDKTISALQGQASMKNITIKNDISDNIIVFSDINMTSTILRNLINNSIKFSNQDSDIIISAFEDNTFCHLSVKDFGVGMDKNTVNNILNKKSMSSSTGTNGEAGSGLGLSICHEMIELCNGKLEIESSIGNGTTFTILLRKAQ